ncbi:hypothetical protein E2C01_062360 [Portunus trituberculatus]|uniref:Uncharacterized protein n=1 Tax=Portunus trituberculatus TaxID=210409 RepID=A0A5B7HDF2_PORTR|nr:hypothetical protein [Portunus trituberculatus]
MRTKVPSVFLGLPALCCHHSCLTRHLRIVHCTFGNTTTTTAVADCLVWVSVSACLPNGPS